MAAGVAAKDVITALSSLVGGMVLSEASRAALVTFPIASAVIEGCQYEDTKSAKVAFAAAGVATCCSLVGEQYAGYGDTAFEGIRRAASVERAGQLGGDAFGYYQVAGRWRTVAGIAAGVSFYHDAKSIYENWNNTAKSNWWFLFKGLSCAASGATMVWSLTDPKQRSATK